MKDFWEGFKGPFRLFAGCFLAVRAVSDAFDNGTLDLKVITAERIFGDPRAERSNQA